MAALDELVYLSPVRDATNVPVVNPDVGFQLPGEVVVVDGAILLGIVTVNSIELDAALATPLNGVVEQLTFAHRPQNEAVMFGNQHSKCIGGERTFVTDFWIFMFDDGAVEIYCNGHFSN